MLLFGFLRCSAGSVGSATGRCSDRSAGFGPAYAVPWARPPRPAITPELRGDIYMARKMYRDAIDMYREGPDDSPVVANKIGIAFHQLLQFDLAKKNYERAIKLDPKYSEAINNLGTIYYAQRASSAPSAITNGR